MNPLLIVRNEDYITVARAAQLLDLSPRRVQEMCQSGVFFSAHKRGDGKKARWKILRNEVLARISNGQVQAEYARRTRFDY